MTFAGESGEITARDLMLRVYKQDKRCYVMTEMCGTFQEASNGLSE